MQVSGTPTDGKITDLMVLAQAIGDNIAIPPVFFQLDFLLVKPDVKTGIGFLKVYHIKIVYQHIRKDGTE